MDHRIFNKNALHIIYGNYKPRGKTTLLFGLSFTAIAFGFLVSRHFSPRGIFWLMQPDQAANLYGWKLAQYKLNYYHFGFVKRDLISNLFELFPNALWYYSTVVFNIGVWLALSTLTVIFLKNAKHSLTIKDYIIFCFLIFLSPLTFMDAGYDFGRFDFFNIVILILTLLCIRKGFCALSCLLTVIALLTHEAYIFYGIPIVALYTIEKIAASKNISTKHFWARYAPCILLMVATLAVLVALDLFGRYEPGYDTLLSKLGSNINADSLKVWTRPVIDNLFLVFHRWENRYYTNIDIFVFIFYLTGIFYLLSAFHAVNNTTNGRFARYAPVATLPLFLLGGDYARWLRLCAVVALIAVSLEIVDSEDKIVFPKGKISIVYALGILAFPLGPIGTEHCFPLWID